MRFTTGYDADTGFWCIIDNERDLYSYFYSKWKCIDEQRKLNEGTRSPDYWDWIDVPPTKGNHPIVRFTTGKHYDGLCYVLDNHTKLAAYFTKPGNCSSVARMLNNNESDTSDWEWLPLDTLATINIDDIQDKPGKFLIPWYLDAYKNALGNFEPKRILEIGVDKGHSLAFWKCIWPQAEVHGVDNSPEAVAPEGTTLHRMTAKQFFTTDRTEFDLIIDDGSHIDTDIQNTIARATVAPGGWLVIEDLVALFDPAYQRDAEDQDGDSLKDCIDKEVAMVLASKHDTHTPPKLAYRHWDRIIIEPWIMFMRRAASR